MIKYRVHEVAKDFGTTYKALAEILTKYSETPKNHMQVLTDRELNIIFDYLTFHNQVASLDEIYAEGRPAQPKEPVKEPEQEQAAAAAAQEPETVKEPKAEAAEDNAPKQPQAQQGAKPAPRQTPAAPAAKQPQQGQKQSQQGQKQPQQGQKQPQQGQKQPQAAQPQQQGKQAGQPQQSSRVPQKRVIDTRSTTLNTAKYDERLDKFVPDKLQNAKQGKEIGRAHV